MNYEKEYNKLVGKIKKAHLYAQTDSTRAVLEDIYPQLSESEDERIKKIITDSVFYQYGAGVEYKDVLDYLDKLEKQKDLTTENIYKHSRERMSFGNGQQKEQKPAESISQLTVQGKGVYKICPRCKERMVRDNTKVYTSMPPQYGYKCPKCGEMEFDTVMYDNPEMEEQKPAEKQDYTTLTDIERAINRGFLSAGVINIPVEIIEETAKECIALMKPAEWSDEDETALGDLMWCIEQARKSAKDENDMGNIWFAENWVKNRLKSLSPQPKQEWSEEDENMAYFVNQFLEYHENADPTAKSCKKWFNNRLKFLKPSWKPSKEQMKALHRCIYYLHGEGSGYFEPIKSLYEQLKKL